MMMARRRSRSTAMACRIDNPIAESVPYGHGAARPSLHGRRPAEIPGRRQPVRAAGRSAARDARASGGPPARGGSDTREAVRRTEWSRARGRTWGRRSEAENAARARYSGVLVELCASYGLAEDQGSLAGGRSTESLVAGVRPRVQARC